MENTKVLVLGSSGMLGTIVWEYLSRNPHLYVKGTVRSEKYQTVHDFFFDAERWVISQEKSSFLTEFDYIINCIGIIKPYCRDYDPIGVERAITVNALFPHKLARVAKEKNIKVIQIATDCVYSGQKGNYTESDPHDPLDVYGKTKSLGEVFDKSILNIRCSIVGPEKKK